MTKINYQEIQNFSKDLPYLKETASHYLKKATLVNQQFLNHAELPEKNLEVMKSCYENYQLMAKAIVDALTTLSTYFKTYLSVLIETVTDPGTKLKLDELHHLQIELSQLQQEKVAFMENMSKTFSDVPTLKKLFTTEVQNQKKKEIDLIQRHFDFEKTTQKHFSNIQLTISAIQHGLLFLKNYSSFDAIDSTSLLLNPTKLSWYNQLFEFNKVHENS